MTFVMMTLMIKINNDGMKREILVIKREEVMKRIKRVQTMKREGRESVW